MTQHNSIRTRRALITGGSRGIGRAIALTLARQGIDIAVTYNQSAGAANKVIDDAKQFGVAAFAIHADARDPAQAASAVNEAATALGGLDILVNNAGVFLMEPLTESASDDVFDTTFTVNVKSVFTATRAAAKHMGDGGRVVTIGSVNGDRMPVPGGAIYAMSKSAVQGLTRGWAQDLAGQGVTVNCVQPGPINTDMNPADGDFAAVLTQMVPLKRYGTAEEVAALTAFLASPEASYITGACLDVDGGFNA